METRSPYPSEKLPLGSNRKHTAKFKGQFSKAPPMIIFFLLPAARLPAQVSHPHSSARRLHPFIIYPELNSVLNICVINRLCYDNKLHFEPTVEPHRNFGWWRTDPSAFYAWTCHSPMWLSAHVQLDAVPLPVPSHDHHALLLVWTPPGSPAGPSGRQRWMLVVYL